MSRRLKSLATIVRVQDRALQARAGEFVALQARLAGTDQALAELARLKREERAVTLPEAMRYMAGFLASIPRESNRLGKAATMLSGQVKHKRGKVMAALQNLKVTDALQERMRGRACGRGGAGTGGRGRGRHPLHAQRRRTR